MCSILGGEAGFFIDHSIPFALMLFFVFLLHVIFSRIAKSSAKILLNVGILIFGVSVGTIVFNRFAYLGNLYKLGNYGEVSMPIIVSLLTGLATVAVASLLNKKHKEVSVSFFARLAMILAFYFMVAANHVFVIWGVLLFFVITSIFYVQQKRNSKKYLIFNLSCY